MYVRHQFFTYVKQDYSNSATKYVRHYTLAK